MKRKSRIRRIMAHMFGSDGIRTVLKHVINKHSNKEYEPRKDGEQ